MSQEPVDRAPGMSVRLKLTLSYAGFLMLAGAVLLVAGYFSLSRGVHPGVFFLVRSHADLLRSFAPIAGVVLVFPGTKRPMARIAPSGTYPRRYSIDCRSWPASQAAASSKTPASIRKPA